MPLKAEVAVNTYALPLRLLRLSCVATLSVLPPPSTTMRPFRVRLRLFITTLTLVRTSADVVAVRLRTSSP